MSELIFNLVRLLKQNISPFELINNFDYKAEDVLTAKRIINYLEVCNKSEESK